MQFTEDSQIRMQRHTDRVPSQWLETRVLGHLLSDDKKKLSSGNNVSTILKIFSLNNNCSVCWLYVVTCASPTTTW